MTGRGKRWDATFYYTRQLKLGASGQLDLLAREAGKVYSRTVVTFWRIYRHKDIWLSSNSMQKLIHDDNLHSQTVQGIVQSFYEALKSWGTLRKTVPGAKPPRRLNRYYAIPFKSSAIKLKDGVLTLSAGKKSEPVTMPWRFQRPKVCEISYRNGGYVLNAVYAQSTAQISGGGGCAGVDLGEVHIATAYTGKRTIIANGRLLRSKLRHKERLKAHFRSKTGKYAKNSRKWKKAGKAAARAASRIDNQIKDILHKQTSAFICAVRDDGVQMVGIGDMGGKTGDGSLSHLSRDRRDREPSPVLPAKKAKAMIIYKARRAGMDVELVDERDTSLICPGCGERNRTVNRDYFCGKCGFAFHRDGVGAANIRSRALYREVTPVVGDMTPPVGIRYYADASRTSATDIA